MATAIPGFRYPLPKPGQNTPLLEMPTKEWQKTIVFGNEDITYDRNNKGAEPMKMKTDCRNQNLFSTGKYSGRGSQRRFYGAWPFEGKKML